MLRVAATAAAGVASATAANMNGKYIVNTGTKQGVNYNDDYASKGMEYFDVWAPEIATQYAQVFWTSQGTLPLPDEIVKRFEGKVIAITGYEQDQVMVTPTGQPGVNPDKDVSVPINWAYNHHYMAWMAGADAEFVEVPSDGLADWMAHGAPTKVIAVPKPSAKLHGYPVSQMFSEGNGGESRKSYHGYPTGHAQLVHSPKTWTITPMQIDTRNRDCGVTPASINNCTKFVPSIEPKQARYGFGIPEGTNYSGILECPCNGGYGGDVSFYGEDTLTKQITHNFVTETSVCSVSSSVATADSCFAAAQEFTGVNTVALKNVTASNSSLPTGCSLSRSAADGSVVATFNTAASAASCKSGTSQVGETHFPETEVTLHLELQADSSVKFDHSPAGQYCSLNHQGVQAKFPMAGAGAEDAQAALAKCEAFCQNTDECTACSVDCSLGNMKVCQWVALPACGTVNDWAGIIAGDISYKRQGGNATITVSGPADKWFGVGFNAVNMHDQPYTLIVNASGVIEQKLGTCGSEADHCPGTQLAPSLTVVSNDVDGSTRTVVVTRPFQGAGDDYFTFTPATTPTTPMISAVGSSPVFAYHAAHGTGLITTLPADGSPACLCDSGKQGQMCDAKGENCEHFVKNCVSEDQGGDLLEQQNPTCNSVQYAGGLRCCGHDRVMLDDGQTCDNCGDLLRYHMKFRFWFQEYTPANATANASHNDLDRLYWTTEQQAGEYDIPPAFARPGIPIPGYPNWPLNKPTPGTHCNGTCPGGPDCECYHEITYRWPSPEMRLIYAGGHCHAPSCISLELFRNDSGKLELICGQYPVYGKGSVADDKYDEAGYISIPPCLWGDDEGLEPSVLLPAGTPLVSIKRNRNTHLGHYGEMASWQMRGQSF
eukprot:INCI8217.1.p1 GENE.INCI8217.1~~INCI8217.1.p1  ORF type:complete len:885 (+),score=119.99 INCI8217.1:128-2782(+)